MTAVVTLPPYLRTTAGQGTSAGQRAPEARLKYDPTPVDAAREGPGHRGSTPLTSTISFGPAERELPAEALAKAGLTLARGFMPGASVYFSRGRDRERCPPERRPPRHSSQTIQPKFHGAEPLMHTNGH